MWLNCLQALAELCTGVFYSSSCSGILIDLNVAELSTESLDSYRTVYWLIVLNLAELSQGDLIVAELSS